MVYPDCHPSNKQKLLALKLLGGLALNDTGSISEVNEALLWPQRMDMRERSWSAHPHISFTHAFLYSMFHVCLCFCILLKLKDCKKPWTEARLVTETSFASFLNGQHQQFTAEISIPQLRWKQFKQWTMVGPVNKHKHRFLPLLFWVHNYNSRFGEGGAFFPLPI